jgi:GAF domain-containing protein
VFDWFARRAALLLAAPMGLVTFVAVDGQVLPGAFGVPEPWTGKRATPLSHSFCQHVVTSQGPLAVANAHDTPLVATNEAVKDLDLVAYLGVPLTLLGGIPGALSASDHRPRRWSRKQLTDLLQLADLCSEVLGRRLATWPAH